jgi:hypothetical protein
LFSVNHNYIHSIALLDRDGQFFLRKSRILALVEIDDVLFTKNDSSSSSSIIQNQIEVEKQLDKDTEEFICTAFKICEENEAQVKLMKSRE